MANGRLWTLEEEAILRQNYAKIGPIGCKKLLEKRGYERTVAAVETKALKKLGLICNNMVTAQEMDFLCANYKEKGAEFCAKQMGRSVLSVKNIAFRLGITERKMPEYTDKEKEFIKRHYRKNGAQYCADMLGVTKKHAIWLAWKIGASRKTQAKRRAFEGNGK